MTIPLSNYLSSSQPSNVLDKTATPLPVSLFDIIAWVESKNNPHAMRFEVAMFDKMRQGIAPAQHAILDKISAAHGKALSAWTEGMIYCTSFGATQIMGFNLYDGLYAGDVASFMGDPIAQAVAFDEFCRKSGLCATPTDLAQFPILRRHFAKIYNGDADAYSAQIVYALQHFGIAVTQ